MPSCSCKDHESFSGGIISPVFKLSNEKVKKDTVDFFRKEGLISNYSNYLCQLCVQYVETKKERNDKRKRSDIDDIISSINEKTISENDLLNFVSAIGNSISEDISKDCEIVSKQYKTVEKLNTFELYAWLKARNKILTGFMFAAAKCVSGECKKDLCVAGAVECIYKARNSQTVCPFAFAQNMVSYYISCSKAVTNLIGSCRPAGTYNTLKKWLREHCTNEIRYVPDCDVWSFFDNTQVVARNWRVNYNYKSKASVITSTLNIHLQSKLQTEENLSPSHWLHIDVDKHQLVSALKNYMEEAKLKYNEIRNAYIKNQLHIAIKNAHYEGKTVIDGITESLRGANIPLNPQGKNADPYDFVPQEHVQPNPVFSTGDPVLRNPCSYESVAEVLQQIQQRSGIGDSHRKWCVAGCDGLPYTLGSRLQEKQPILKNVLLVPGHGHIEINAVKALFKLLWEPLLQDLAKKCGFNSIRAQVCAKNCADHHKSFMLLDISTQACLNEILFVFFNFAKKEQQEPSLKNLYKYISHSKDRNFRFISDVLFNYLIALKIYRAGVRRNNATCIKAGKSQLMKLFFGFGMRNYQEIAIKDTKTRVLAPPEILEFLEKHESFSVSGNPSKGEWGDFILESVNSKIKRWLPPGIPKESHWKEVCRNADILQKIRDNVYKQSGLQEDKSKYIYHRDIQHAVFLYQTRLRQSGYLNNTGHTEEC